MNLLCSFQEVPASLPKVRKFRFSRNHAIGAIRVSVPSLLQKPRHLSERVVCENGVALLKRFKNIADQRFFPIAATHNIERERA